MCPAIGVGVLQSSLAVRCVKASCLWHFPILRWDSLLPGKKELSGGSGIQKQLQFKHLLCFTLVSCFSKDGVVPNVSSLYLEADTAVCWFRLNGLVHAIIPGSERHRQALSTCFNDGGSILDAGWTCREPPDHAPDTLPLPYKRPWGCFEQARKACLTSCFRGQHPANCKERPHETAAAHRSCHYF